MSPFLRLSCAFTFISVIAWAGRGTAAQLDCSVPVEYELLPGSFLDYDKCDGALARCKTAGMRYASDYSGCIPAQDFVNWNCLILDADATLCSGDDSYNMTVLAAESFVSLDCADQTIDHGFPAPPIQKCACKSLEEACERPSNHSVPLKNVAIRFTRHRSLTDIEIRDCRIQNTGFSAVEMMRMFRGDRLHSNQTEGHSNVLISGLSTRNVKFGLYVGQASRRVSLLDSSLILTRQIGVYLEAASQETRIEGTTVAWTLFREGLAVDSSSNNEIYDNVFANNCGTDSGQNQAIMFYRNCGELQGQICPITRGTSSSNNIVSGNAFIGDHVIIGSRQGRYYKDGWCADLDGQCGRGQDNAHDNVFMDNVFQVDRTHAAITIRDGGQHLRGNRFVPLYEEHRKAVAIYADDGSWDATCDDGQTCCTDRPPGVDVTGNSIEDNEFVDVLVQSENSPVVALEFIGDTNTYSVVPPPVRHEIPLPILSAL